MTLPQRLGPSNNQAAQCLATVVFIQQFGISLPLGLREQAGAMCWERFVATYGHTAGRIRLGNWACIETERRRGPQPCRFRATIAVGDRISTSTTAASGPIAALSVMLHERGIPLEILNFHQLRSGRHTATLVRGSNGARTEWAMGWSEDSTQSALRALIACANRLIV